MTPTTKRIVLNLTSAEYEELKDAVEFHCEAERVYAYDDQPQAINGLLEKMRQNYEKNGVP